MIVTYNASPKPLGQLGLLRDMIPAYACSRGFKTLFVQVSCKRILLRIRVEGLLLAKS